MALDKNGDRAFDSLDEVRETASLVDLDSEEISVLKKLRKRIISFLTKELGIDFTKSADQDPLSAVVNEILGFVNRIWKVLESRKKEAGTAIPV